MVSNAFEDVARVIELVTPAAPALFLPLAATATFVRTAALTGRGSLVNGSLMQHFARNENTADVRARLEVQGRWLALVALPVGIGIFRTVSQTFASDPEEPARDVAIAVALYGGVVCAHLVCIWNAAKVLRFETLNRARLVRQARAFRDGGAARPSPITTRLAKRKECFARGFLRRSNPRGVPPGRGEGLGAPRASRRARAGWIYFPDGTSSRVFGSDRRRTKVRAGVGSVRDGGCPARCSSTPDATARDVPPRRSPGARESTGVRGGDDAEGFRRAYAWGDARVDEFVAAMAANGWRVDFVQLGTAPRYRLGSLLGRIGRRGSGGGTRGGKGGASGWTRRSTTSSRREVDE